MVADIQIDKECKCRGEIIIKCFYKVMNNINLYPQEKNI